MGFIPISFMLDMLHNHNKFKFHCGIYTFAIKVFVLLNLIKHSCYIKHNLF